MPDIQKLQEFLVKAKKSTYASGDETSKIKEVDGSTTLIFEEGDFKYHDNYFGGEPYGGREVVFFQDKPIYIMVYYGWVDNNITDFKEVYKVLQHALSLIPESNPYRGPQEYVEGAYVYSNNFIGSINNFSGEEMIRLNSQEIYRAKYMGGLVDQRKEV